MNSADLEREKQAAGKAADKKLGSAPPTNSFLMRRATFFSVENAEVKAALVADTRPMHITNFMVERPCCVVSLGYVVLLLLAVI